MSEMETLRLLNSKIADFEECVKNVFGTSTDKLVLGRGDTLCYVVDMRPFMKALGGKWLQLLEEHKKLQVHSTYGIRE